MAGRSPRIDPSRSREKSGVVSRWQMANLERGIGCENCGAEVKAANKYGIEHCGKKACQTALLTVGKSRDRAEELKRKRANEDR